MALEVQIGANSDDLNSEIAAAEAKLKRLGDLKIKQTKLGLDTTDLNKQIASTKNQLTDLKESLKTTGNSFSSFAPKVANGNNALTQFNRIIQDAPFGAMGVQNNVTSFGESFGYLINQTGSAKAAFAAMTGALIGSGGVLLAISLVTSGLTYMSQNGLTVSDVFNKISGDFDKTRQSMQELNAEAVKGSQAQVSEMNAYVSVAKNVNLSMTDRLIAVKKLQEEYPAYFGNLTKEQILNGNVAGAVREITSALIAKAKAAALTDRIVKLAEEEENIQNQINNSIAAQFKFYKLTKQEAFDAAVILNKQLRGQIDLVAELTAGRANDLSKAEKTALASFQYSKTLQELSGNLRSNKSDQDRLTNSLNNQYSAFIKLETEKDKAAKKVKAPNVTPQVSGLGSTLQPMGLKDTAGQIMQIAKGVQGAEGVITTSMGNIRTVYDSSLLGMLEMMKSFNDEMNSLVMGSITDTFGNLGNAIGQALATGGNVLNAVGNTLLQSLGGFLSDMGGLLIKYGALAVVKGKLDLAIATGGPVSVAAGLAAIAVGVALKAAGGAIGARAQGGSSGGNQKMSTGANYSSPASSGGSYSSGGYGGGKVVFEISGQSLIGVLSNTLEKNTRLGGKLSIS
jgi:hypothetical protein